MPAPRKAMPAPLWFHLLAGPNGAGKSTLYRALVRQGILVSCHASLDGLHSSSAHSAALQPLPRPRPGLRLAPCAARR